MKDPSLLPVRVGCAVSAAWPTRVALRAVEREGGTALPLTMSRFLDGKDLNCNALIYDLFPWGEDGRNRLRALRASHPTLPILLFLPMNPTCIGAVSDVVGLSNVKVRVQDLSGVTANDLAKDIRWLIQAGPRERVVNLVETTVPSLSTPACGLVHNASETLGLGKRPSVEGAAKSLGMSCRTLERHLRDASLPGPKRLIDWVTMLYIVVLADATNSSLPRSARQIRLNSNDLYRMRRRLLRGRAEGLGPSELVSVLPDLFRQDCVGQIDSDRAVLETWVRSSIPRTGTAGRVSWSQFVETRTATQMAVAPLSVGFCERGNGAVRVA